MSVTDKTRLIVVKLKDSDEKPYVIGAYPESTWEIVPPEEYDEWRRGLLDLHLYEPADYEVREVVMKISAERFEPLFVPPDISLDDPPLEESN